MLKTRSLVLLLLLGLALTGALSSCLSAPTYPTVPVIEFKSLNLVRTLPTPADPSVTDTFKITVSFQDNEGDLGLTPEEVQNDLPPYNRLNADGTPNPNHFNYNLRLFRRTPPNTQFEEVYPNQEFAQFPLLNGGLQNKAAPLKGDLTLKRFYNEALTFSSGDEVKFTVSIKDRALHESNTVETSVQKIP